MPRVPGGSGEGGRGAQVWGEFLLFGLGGEVWGGSFFVKFMSGKKKSNFL